MTFADIDWALILAGLGLFLFGINYMGEGLKSFSGEKLKDVIDKYTSSPLKGIMIGTVVTCLIQSSSGTTALTIGLIRSGLMTLNQGVGIIMGANIGTTITAFIVGLNISEFSVYFIIIGAIFLMFFSKKKLNYLGQILFGFGCLFYGLELMSDNLKVITEIPQFLEITEFMAQNPYLGLVGGIFLTMVIQSSSAVIAIVQQMYGLGAISLSIALPFLFGSNIGTTITAILASFGGSTPAKRAAAFHTMFNVIGTAIFMILLNPFQSLIMMIEANFALSAEMLLAVAHGIFNITTTALMYPFISQMVSFIKLIIQKSEKEYEMDFSSLELNQDVVNLFPSHALEIAKVKITEMGEITYKAVESVNEYFTFKNSGGYQSVFEMENAINILDNKITEYMVLISQETLNEDDSMSYMSYMTTIKDFERIGDLCINLTKYFEAIYEEKEDFSKEAKDDITSMLELVSSMVNDTIHVFEYRDSLSREKVFESEDKLDKLNKESKKRHVKRVAKQIEKSALVNSTYVDILANMERMGDHCKNIAEYFTEEGEIVQPKHNSPELKEINQ